MNFNFKEFFKTRIKKPSHKIFLVFVILIFILTTLMYSVAEWYIYSERNKPVHLGVSFIPDYASSLELNPKETFKALLNIDIKYFRLTSYWNDIEQTKGTYDFSMLDWEFEQANTHNAKIMLTLGLRQPRWPECHMPTWATNEPTSLWYQDLNKYIKTVVDRYKNNRALESYQLENEFSLKNFGKCTNFDTQRLKKEYALVKQTDPNHPVIISRSDNFPSPLTTQPVPDIVGFSVYRRVWDATITKRYFTYPMPSWYFAYQAGLQKILTGKESQIHELQAEAWPPNQKDITQISLAEQNKSIDAKSFQDRITYAKDTGMKQIYLWGGEYWYYRKVKLNDPSLWNVAYNNYKNCN